MLEESFWTIGFRKVRHKRARGIWVYYLEGSKWGRPLKTISEGNMGKIMKFSTKEEVNFMISKSAASIMNEKEQEAFDFAQYTAIQVSVKNVKSNTKG